MAKVLVAGASGALGRRIIETAERRGFRVRALGRRHGALQGLGASETALADPVSGRGLEEALVGVDVLVSALGASVSPEFGKGYRSFRAVDTPANLQLLRAAERARVPRFVYVSLACEHELSELAYVRAHEDVVRALQASQLDYAVLRPTGFFSAFGALVGMAARGAVPLIGNPEAKTNPIAEDDIAEQCVELLQRDSLGRTSLELGGPDVFTRREIMELAFRVQRREPKLRRLPDGLVKTLALLMRPFNPRVSDLLRFVLGVSSRDCVAPPIGVRRLADYFEVLAKS
ncbi:MAG: SDR family oxidoreductase [Myxococcota bacterium]